LFKISYIHLDNFLLYVQVADPIIRSQSNCREPETGQAKPDFEEKENIQPGQSRNGQISGEP
jgi:hypothetical protein